MKNSDVYKLIISFDDKLKGKPLLSLEEYLSSLWLVVSQEWELPLTIERFSVWIEKAFFVIPPVFNSDWLNRKLDNQKEDVNYENATYQDWENVILFQIADLRRIAKISLLDAQAKHFGIESPSGEHWYNFDPLTYLECGVAGSMDGYDDSPCEIETFSWKDFIAVLKCGQLYE